MPIPFDQCITCSVSTAVEASELSRSTIYELINEGKLETVKVAGRRLVLVDSLQALLRDPAAAS